MIQLAVLLIGARAFRQRLWVPALIGLVLIAFGFALVVDMGHAMIPIATRVFGLTFLLRGLAALIAGSARATVFGTLVAIAKALVFVALGVLALWTPFGGEMILGWLLAAGLAVDGVSRLITIWLVRFKGWAAAVASSVLELVLAAVMAFEWPLPAHLNIPLCIGLLLVLSGIAMVRLSFVLRNEPEEMALFALSMFGGRNWNENAPVLIGDDMPEDWEAGPMRVRIWTPVGSAKVAARRPVIDRYFGAMDVDGVFSAGHAALELLPDLYISHWPAQEIDQASGPLAQIFHAGAHNDMPGRFLPSYDEERTIWCDADRSVAFNRFNARRLRAYWAGYRQRTIYNLTDRNCSIAVAGALDSALEGSLHTRIPWLRLVGLLLNPALWEAAYWRSRARHVCWTPGMVLDYAEALQRLVEPGQAFWRIWINRLPGRSSTAETQGGPAQ
jgi:uncharacterized membrane protein HdeD (DUF308 family)